MSILENELEFQMKAAGLPEAVREFKFCSTRNWRADYTFPSMRILIEVEGATWSGGRHTRGQGYEDDCEKYNTAQELGFVVLRFTSGPVRSGEALATIERFLRIRGWSG